MFGMGLTIHMGDFKVVFTRPKEVILGFIAQYTLMPVIAWLLATAFHLPADLALGVILVAAARVELQVMSSLILPVVMLLSQSG